MAAEVLIYINLILLAISILAIIAAAFRGSFTGGVEIQRIAPIFIAVVAFIVSYFLLGGVARALIIALLVMLAVSILALILTGARGITSL
jgi:hypothetical protein